MLAYVSKYSFDKLINMLLGHTVHFESDCMMFPIQGINGKVISYKIVNNELVFKIKRSISLICELIQSLQGPQHDS